MNSNIKSSLNMKKIPLYTRTEQQIRVKFVDIDQHWTWFVNIKSQKQTLWCHLVGNQSEKTYLKQIFVEFVYAGHAMHNLVLWHFKIIAYFIQAIITWNLRIKLKKTKLSMMITYKESKKLENHFLIQYTRNSIHMKQKYLADIVFWTKIK